jgi:hypothetical protein
MEKPSKKPVGCSSKAWLICFLVLFFNSQANAEKRYEILEHDTSRYPQVTVELKARENLFGKENEVLITEDIGTAKKVVTDYNLSVHSEPFPVHIYLSIPSYVNLEEKRWLIQFSHNIATLAEKSRGRFFLNVQADDQFIFYEGIPASKLTPAFSLPKEREPKYPIRSWEKVISKMRSDDFPNKILITVSLQSDWEDKFRIAEFAKKANQDKINFFVVAPNSLETTKLASYVNGKFFPISSEEGISSLYTELNYATAPKVRLVYISPWNHSLWSHSLFNVSVTFGEEKSLEFAYEISALTTLYQKITDPFVFYPVLFFFIILCFSVLYYLRGYENTKGKELAQTLPLDSAKKIENTQENQKNRSEIEVYERVYGEISEKARGNQIVSEYLDRDEVIGETYNTCFLIAKEGAFTGEQFRLKEEETRIGRGADCDLVLNDPYAEILHAKIKKVRGRQLLFDCASEAGVLLNGRKLLRPKALHDLDEIRIGKSLFSFRGR